MMEALFQVEYGYTCDECQQGIVQDGKTPRYHCWDCKDYDACEPCYKKKPHLHKLLSKELGIVYY